MNTLCLLACVSLFIALSATASPPSGSINIASYGAKGDGSDATQPIRNAINASSDGQVIWFPTGTYTISSTIVLLPNRVYQGDLNSVLHSPTENDAIFQANNGAASNLNFNGLTFDNGQVVIYTDTAYAQNFQMKNCIFQNNTNNCQGQNNCPSPRGLFFDYGLGPSNAVISWNSFYNLQSFWSDIQTSDDGDSCGIGMYSGVNVEISHNRFDLVQEGVKVFESSELACQNIRITDNHFTRIHRMGVETQCFKGYGWLYQNNFLEDFNTPFWNTFGISARSDGNYNISLIGNTILMLGAPIGWYGYALEVNGNGAVNIVQNFLYGPHCGDLVFCTAPTTGVLNVTNNNVCNNDSIASIIFPEYGTYCLSNPNTKVTPNTWVQCLTDSSIPSNYPPRPAAGANQSPSLLSSLNPAHPSIQHPISSVSKVKITDS